MQRLVLISFVALLASAFVLSPFLHDIIPHTHGDHHGAAETVVWRSLHNATQHDDKKLTPVPIVSVMLVLLVARAYVHMRARFNQYEIHDPFRSRYLTRGIARYRVFG